MEIREQEDKLFSEWRKEDHIQPFTIDGCPNPRIYGVEDTKTIFVLKDVNLDEKDNKGRDFFPLRKQLEEEPHKWWHTIAKWCYFLHSKDHTWEQAQKELPPKNKSAIREMLAHHCFVQLKKEGGSGSVSDKTLHKTINTVKYKDNLIKQLSIYQPNFIIACGTGEHLSIIFNCSKADSKQTSKGVKYWCVDLAGKPSYLIDYCHPSVRCGTKVKGLIAKGLSEAIFEIKPEGL